MPNEYTARALAILEHDARYMDFPDGGGFYFVTVNGKRLVDTDTYELRLKIENELRNR